jgi:hypothetical protein
MVLTVSIWLLFIWNTGALGFDAFDFVHNLMGDRRGAYKVVVGRPDGKRPLGRSRHRWEGIIKMDRSEVG